MTISAVLCLIVKLFQKHDKCEGWGGGKGQDKNEFFFEH